MNPFDFKDLDLEKIMELLESLTPEERRAFDQLGEALSDNLSGEQMDAMAEKMRGMFEPETPESGSLAERLHVSQEVLDQMDDLALDYFDAAFQLEDFYQEDIQADYAPVLLLWLKGILALLRAQLSDKFFPERSASTLSFRDFAQAIRSSEMTFLDAALLDRLAFMITRVETDFISKEENDYLIYLIDEESLIPVLLNSGYQA